jgi:hypothetical protein
MRFPRNFEINFFNLEIDSEMFVGMRARGFLVLIRVPNFRVVVISHLLQTSDYPLLTIHYPLLTSLLQSSPLPATSPEYRLALDKSGGTYRISNRNCPL